MISRIGYINHLARAIQLAQGRGISDLSESNKSEENKPQVQKLFFQGPVQSQTLQITYKNVSGIPSDDHRFNKIVKLSEASEAKKWSDIKSQWKTGRLIFSPGGIQNARLVDQSGELITCDEFGNYPHWVYELSNIKNGTVIYIGPNDIQTLFPEKEKETNGLREDKEELIKGYVGKSVRVLRLSQMISNQEEIAALVGLVEEPNKIGDRHFEQIDLAYAKLDEGWKNKFCDLPLDRYFEICDDLEAVNKTLSSRKRGLSFLPLGDQTKLSRILASLSQGNLPTAHDVAFLTVLHKKLLECQNHFVRESAGWALKKARAVNVAQEAKTPAYHANFYIANWLLSLIQKTNQKTTVLDIGANLSNFWRTFNHVIVTKGVQNIPCTIYDLEREKNIYDSAPNPNRALANIAELNEQMLPKVQEVTSEESRIFLQNPHSFNTLVASFVLDQLDPNDLKQTVIAFENLLDKPQDQKLTLENLDQFPLLVITCPEHSPIPGTGFEKVLKQSGYTTVIQEQNLVNPLTSEARERILTDEGGERLHEIEQLVLKPFHLYVFAKTQAADINQLERMPKKNFIIRGGQARKRTHSEKPVPLVSTTRVDIGKLIDIDVIASLKPDDFQAQAQSIVTRATIIHDPAYDEFEDRLACLIYFSNYLTTPERARLNMLVDLWDKQQVQFLSKEQVDFVISQPDLTNVSYSKLPINLQHELDQGYKPILDAVEREKTADRLSEDRVQAAIRAKKKELQKQKYSIWEVCKLESNFRKQTNRQTLLEETRPILAQRVKLIKSTFAGCKDYKTAMSILTKALCLHYVPLSLWCEKNNVNLIELYRTYKQELTPSEAVKRFTDETTTGKRLATLRNNKKWDRSELADRLNKLAEQSRINIRFNNDQVSRWERDGNPDTENLALLSRVFEVNKEDIIPSLKERSVHEVTKDFTCQTSISSRIKALRINKNWTKLQLVERFNAIVDREGLSCKINKSHVDNWENLGFKPRPERLAILCKLFFVNITDMIPERAVEEIKREFTNEISTSQRIKMLRKNKGWNRTRLVEELNKKAVQLGKKPDVNLGRAYSWEIAGTTPNPDDLKLLAALFKVKKTDIVLSKEEIPPSNVVRDFTASTQVGDRIKALRGNKEWSLVQLANEINKLGRSKGLDVHVTKERVSSWENRGHIPNKVDLGLLAELYGVKEKDIVPSKRKKLKEKNIKPIHKALPVNEVVASFTLETLTCNRITALRKNENLNQTELCNKLNQIASQKGLNHTVTRTRVVCWENRGNIPNKIDLSLLADLFQINESDIVPIREVLSPSDIIAGFETNTPCSERIRRLRINKNWSQEELAKKLNEEAVKKGISDYKRAKVNVSNWEVRGTQLTAVDLQLLSGIFGVDESNIDPPVMELSPDEIVRSFTKGMSSSERIKLLRGNKHWTQASLIGKLNELSKKIGLDDYVISDSRVISWENHGTTPNPTDLDLMASIFQVKEADIVPGCEEVASEEIVKIFTSETTTGDRIISLRKNKKWSRLKLAENMNEIAKQKGMEPNVNEYRIHSWEYCGTIPNENDLLLLTYVFAVSKDNIVN